jgi:hypothetical protein
MVALKNKKVVNQFLDCKGCGNSEADSNWSTEVDVRNTELYFQNACSWNDATPSLQYFKKSRLKAPLHDLLK